MDTALLAYSGISVKMLVDSNLGAELLTMFMVDYEPGGAAQVHDHPFEETYLFLEGEIEAEIEGEATTFRAGDVLFCGVGVLHGFFNTSSGRARWIETQAPQPPRRHSYRWPARLGASHRSSRGPRQGLMSGSVVIIGGTSGIGLELAKEFVELGDEVVISGRDAERAQRIASGLGPRARGVGVDLSVTKQIAGALSGIGEVKHLVIAAIERDSNHIATYDREPCRAARYLEAGWLSRGGPHSPPASGHRCVHSAFRRPRQGAALPGIHHCEHR